MHNLSIEKIFEKAAIVQDQWAQGIIDIGKAFVEQKDYIAITNNFLDELYYFNEDKVLFKPTKACVKQFRKKKNEFISYFIGINKISDEDRGFALEPWKKISFNNFDNLFVENILISMGNYFFTNYDNEQTKVEYTFGYMLNKQNNLKIIFHHSSIPYKS